MAIVGIVGFIGSGKGTVGELLETKYGFKAESFAKPLKDACSIIFGWNRDLLEGRTEASREWREKVDPYWSKVLGKPNFTPRLALQLMGTQAGRNVFGDTLWTASCMQRCAGGNYVVTDCRFRNEMKAIKDAGGTIIRVKRGPEPHWFVEALCYRNGVDEYMEFYNDAVTKGKQIHESEWDWVADIELIDFTIENEEGNPASMENQLRDILTYVKNTQDPFLNITLENQHHESIK